MLVYPFSSPITRHPATITRHLGGKLITEAARARIHWSRGVNCDERFRYDEEHFDQLLLTIHEAPFGIHPHWSKRDHANRTMINALRIGMVRIGCSSIATS